MAKKTISICLDEEVIDLLNKFTEDGGTKNFSGWPTRSKQSKSDCIQEMILYYLRNQDIELLDKRGNYIPMYDE